MKKKKAAWVELTPSGLVGRSSADRGAVEYFVLGIQCITEVASPAIVEGYADGARETHADDSYGHLEYLYPDKMPDTLFELLITHDRKGMKNPMRLGFCSKSEHCHWFVSMKQAIEHALHARKLSRTKKFYFSQDALLLSMLTSLYKTKFRGGQIKWKEEEEWTYFPNGTLVCEYGPCKDQKFAWNGYKLIPDEGSRKLGKGLWDGLIIQWVDPSERSPIFLFKWDAASREFQNASYIWKFVRNFLISKDGLGEWIINGDVPEPIPMFLMMMRSALAEYWLLSSDADKPAEA